MTIGVIRAGTMSRALLPTLRAPGDDARTERECGARGTRSVLGERDGGPWRVRLAVVATIALFGSAFPVVKVALEELGPGEVALARFACASAVLGVLVLTGSHVIPPFPAWRAMAAVGVTAVSGYHLLFNLGQQTVSASAASVLINTGPIWTSLFAAGLLHERPSWRTWCGLAIAFIGAALIAVGERGAMAVSLGAVIIIAAAMLQAASFVLQKPLVTTFGVLPVTAVSVWIGTAVLAVFFGADTTAAVLDASWRSIAAVAYLGIGSSALGLLCWAYVLSRMPASTAAPYLLLVPLAASAIAMLLLAETPSRATAAGGVVTLCGVAWAQGLGRGRRAPVQ